jgi:hypothetical protein
MAIVTPPIFTGLHEEEILENSRLLSFNEEFYKKLGLNNNWLIDLRPVGSICFINVNQLGGSVPDTSVWQQCNGSEITNPNSPIRSIGINRRYTPDFRDRYLKIHPTAIGNTMDGTQTHLLQHNHSTGYPSSVGSGLEDKGDRHRRVAHTHNIAVQYEEETIFDSPAYIYLIPYMKVV